MKKRSALLSTVFALCCCSQHGQENNITFHADKKTWNEAVKHCANNGGVIYSDEKDIRNQTELNNNENVWTGKYEAFTPWSIIWGCYRVNLEDNSNDIFSVTYAEQPECQKKCTGTNFFTVKGNICKCLHPTEVDEQRKEQIQPCNCSTCVTVLRHSIDNVGTRSNTGCSPKNTDCTCMAAACINNILMLTPETCDKEYEGVCDNDNSIFSGQEDAIQNCYTQGSNLRWYSQDQDRCDFDPSRHWTSGRRSIYQYIVQYNEKASNLNPLHCFRLNTEKDRLPEFVDCDNTFLPFFCKIGGSVHEDNALPKEDIQSNNTAGGSVHEDNALPKEDIQSNNIADLIVGIAVSIVVIILILVVLLAVLLLRKYQKDKLSLKTAGREDRDTNEMDNYIIISDYQQLDKVKNRKTKTKPYDQLHVKHPVDSYQTDDHSNTLSSREEHNKYESIENKNEIVFNKVTLEYEVLYKTQQDKMTKAYDQLHYPHVVDTDSTNNHSTTIIESEQKHKTSTNTTSLEYEELNNAEKDKSVNVYDQLNITNEGNFNANMSKTMISTAEHISNESIEAATAMDKHTVTLEYEQLDIAGKEEGINVYDQLHVTP